MNVFRMWGLGAGSVAVAFALSQSLACSSSSPGPSDNDGGNGGSSSGQTSSGGSSGTGSSGAASSSGSSGGGSSSGGSSSGAVDQDGGGSSSSSSGGGGCDAGVYSFDMTSGNTCIASYAPRMPSSFTAGHCPTGTDGCCFKQGPCGFTSNCNYNLGALASQAMTQCTNGGGTWQASPP